MVGPPPTVQPDIQWLIPVLKDLNLRMPREEARDIFERIKAIGMYLYDPLQPCIDKSL